MVAVIIVQHEDSDSIAEGLAVIKSLSASLDKCDFVIDHSAAERNALQTVFPGNI